MCRWEESVPLELSVPLGCIWFAPGLMSSCLWTPTNPVLFHDGKNKLTLDPDPGEFIYSFNNLFN